jgi:hypothetical protein
MILYALFTPSVVIRSLGDSGENLPDRATESKWKVPSADMESV